MPKRTCLAIILAAGEGTRMRSAIPKVMHPVGSRPMLGYVLDAARTAGAGTVATVVGPSADAVSDYAKAAGSAVFIQKDRLGTAHAVLAARKAFTPTPDDILVLYGDTPLLTGKTLRRMRRALASGADVVVLGFRPPDPAAYGRLIMNGKRLVAIREMKDASREEKAIGFVNAGVMGFSGAMAPLLKKIGNDNAKKEYYLPDLVALANRADKTVRAIEVHTEEVIGVNTRAELALVERTFQEHARQAAMDGGVTLIDPDTVYFSHDTRIGRDVVVEPHVFFARGVTVGDNATVRAYSHLEGATVGIGATVGPFARLRPETTIGPGARIGNFVEVKNAVVDAGAKASHLAYIGDAHIGAGANVGAGAITCNYDGYFKHHTEIGAGAFVGSNSALVAPVTIGEGAYIGSGSVISKDVADDALAVGRGRQVDKPGWAASFRKQMQRRKKQSGK
ncbi:bifunctional UDP-N-acetylglucosamine diphosphorylase/glucosamine-1-phosphate N-acetyltransferase GlmU [Bauldia sp.]|uniref:bifunctional UDP-N-acetylglucosamine diphosphorylase/glucosamine-1-phosphate N-acetyltransferase GlmU n=1 Tax=Bauldia sp. TaxID=2575872 RepID=UPI003BAA0ADF